MLPSDAQRNVKVAARRIPVRLLINHPPSDETTPRTSQPTRAAGPAPKRNRRDSWRPSLDFEKMNQVTKIIHEAFYSSYNK